MRSKLTSCFPYLLICTSVAIGLSIAGAGDAQNSAVVGSQVASSGNVFQALILGIVQGITEFLPISSTGHLLVTTKIFGWQELGSKDYVDAIQFGSVIAVLIYFWKDIVALIQGSLIAVQRRDWQHPDFKIVAGIAIGSLPALIIGFLAKDLIPDTAVVIAVMSLVMATLLFLAERLGMRKRDFNKLNIQDGALVGLAQALALVPGVSRSGSTLTAGLFLGLERETAARFSFLVGLPVLAIATLYKSLKIYQQFTAGELPDNILLLLIVGIVSTFIFSYLSIAFLLGYLKRKDTMIFVWYRYAFGASLLIALAMGWKA
jgi:undecaprenyl-diphosphatase